jgi:hypothetical protein
MHSSMKHEHLANSTGPSALLMRLPPWRPLVPSLQDSNRASPSLLLPLHSLSGELPMVGNQALKSGNGRPLWKVSTKLSFLHGTTKTDAHDLPLAIPASILSRTNSNLQVSWDFIFQRNLDFISNSNFNPSGLLSHPYISSGAPQPCIPMPISPQN